MKTAQLVRKVSERKNLYRLSEPLEGFEFVVSSYGSPMVETYLFGADESGEVVKWSELDGSFKGDYNHTEALANAGYTVQP